MNAKEKQQYYDDKLNGRDFKVGESLYSFVYRKGNRVYLSWGNNRATDYTLTTVLHHLNVSCHWELIPLKIESYQIY